MVLVAFLACSGLRAVPSQPAWATSPLPSPGPIAARPVANPAPRIAAHVGETGRPEKLVYSRMNEITREKVAGVWQTADPMIMLVFRRLIMAGWRAIPVQAAAAG
jgi:hypothetical protein